MWNITIHYKYLHNNLRTFVEFLDQSMYALISPPCGFNLHRAPPRPALLENAPPRPSLIDIHEPNRWSGSSNCNLSCWLVFSLFDKRLEISQLSNSSHIYCFLNRKGALSPCTIFSKLKRAVTRLLSELGRKWKLLASLLPPFCCFRIGSVSV